MPRVNGMLMSTSGRQKKPRSARITRKSCASASIAAAGERMPLDRGDGRDRQRQQPRQQRVHVDDVLDGNARRSATSQSRSSPLEKNLPVAVVTSARWPSAALDRRQVLLHGDQPVGVEAVLGVAEVEDEDLAVAVQRGHAGNPY